MSIKKEVTFAVDYETKGGRNYKAGSTHKIDSPEARILLRLGKVRLADSTPSVEEPAADAVTGTPAADTAGDGDTAEAVEPEAAPEQAPKAAEPTRTATARKGK